MQLILSFLFLVSLGVAFLFLLNWTWESFVVKESQKRFKMVRGVHMHTHSFEDLVRSIASMKKQIQGQSDRSTLIKMVRSLSLLKESLETTHQVMEKRHIDLENLLKSKNDEAEKLKKQFQEIESQYVEKKFAQDSTEEKIKKLELNIAKKQEQQEEQLQEVEPDDLKKIFGIGKGIEKKLNQHFSITTYQDILNIEEEDAETIMEKCFPVGNLDTLQRWKKEAKKFNKEREKNTPQGNLAHRLPTQAPQTFLQ